MTADEHTISGPHFHVTRGGYASGLPYERICMTAQRLHDQDERDAWFADLVDPKHHADRSLADVFNDPATQKLISDLLQSLPPELRQP